MNLTGNIIDIQTGQPIDNATVQEVYYQAAGSQLTPFGPVFSAPGGNYSLNISNLNSDQYFQFTAPGYNLFYANDNSLAANTTVYLSKEGKEKILLAGGALALLLLANNKKNKVGKITVDDVKPYILIGGILVVTGLFKKLLTALGVYNSADTTALNNAASNPGSFWNPSFYKQFTTFPNGDLSKAQALQYIVEINDAFGVFSDNVSQVNAIFHQLTSQAEVSFLAEVMQEAFNQDLLTWLRGSSWPTDHLSDSEVQAISNYISNLPTH